MSSNCIVIDGKRVSLPKAMIDAGFTASNFIDDGNVRFDRKDRKKKLVHFVLHETCGNTAKGCMNTLLKKKHGVQLILDPFNHVSCHGDLVRDVMIHANQLNGTSFGCEVVNPYSPLYVIDSGLWWNTIERRWWTWVPSIKTPGVVELMKRRGMTEVPKLYVTPTESQMKFMRMFVPWVCEQTGVPYVFPTKEMKKGSPDYRMPGPGIVAHQDFAAHADGRYMLEDLIGVTQ